jgi:uncharacterized protein
MIIDLATATSTPRHVAADVESEQIDLDGEGTVAGSAHLDGELFRDGSKTHLRGTVTADIDLRCTRCGEAITRHLDIPFEDLFVDASEEPADDDHEVHGEDLDVQVLHNAEIDLVEIVREQILLDLPEQVFCKEDCKGLCPQCGADLNKTDCSCGEKDIDPRWAALKDLS